MEIDRRVTGSMLSQHVGVGRRVAPAVPFPFQRSFASPPLPSFLPSFPLLSSPLFSLPASQSPFFHHLFRSSLPTEIFLVCLVCHVSSLRFRFRFRFRFRGSSENRPLRASPVTNQVDWAQSNPAGSNLVSLPLQATHLCGDVLAIRLNRLKPPVSSSHYATLSKPRMML